MPSLPDMGTPDVMALARAAADAQPDALYPRGDGAFEFQRTVSRLEEMRSEAYLVQGHGA